MIDFSKLKRISIRERIHKVHVKDFVDPDADLLDSFPDILGGAAFRQVVEAIANAVWADSLVLVMMGGHVIKCGLSPMICRLMREGVIGHVALNGGASIHDFEIAYFGETSEEVGETLQDGRFGMVEETGHIMNEALKSFGEGGYGAAVGRWIVDHQFPHKDLSIMATGTECAVPVTVHAAIGAETIHSHPDCDGAAVGAASYEDFRHFVESAICLENGVVLNLGSAVVLPEVFLKALSVARNLGYPVSSLTTANFDMIRHYRPTQNVVERPTSLGGEGYTLLGMHEIMIPLLYHSVLRRLQGR